MTATVIETDSTDDVVTQPVSGTGNVGIGSATQAPVGVNIGQSVGFTGYLPADRMYTTLSLQIEPLRLGRLMQPRTLLLLWA